MRIALYARVSTSDQDVAMQLDDLRRYPAPGDEVTEYADSAMSGLSRSRPQLDAMMAAAEAGQVDAVIVWRFDRFARSSAHLLEALATFTRLGVRFVSLKESIDTATPVGKLVLTILAAVAELERETIRQRVAAGRERALREGTRSGRPFGRPVTTIDPEAAKKLRADGYSWPEVCARLGASERTIRRRIAGE